MANVSGGVTHVLACCLRSVLDVFWRTLSFVFDVERSLVQLLTNAIQAPGLLHAAMPRAGFVGRDDRVIGTDDFLLLRAGDRRHETNDSDHREKTMDFHNRSSSSELGLSPKIQLRESFP